jgi:hypothetical protein
MQESQGPKYRLAQGMLFLLLFVAYSLAFAQQSTAGHDKSVDPDLKGYVGNEPCAQ